MKFLGYDSPIMSFLSKVADLFILNALTLIFSIPLVTIGAATTAAHFAALKIHRDEGHVFRNFWKSFKQNLKQSTGIWLIFVAYCFLAITSFNIASQMGGKMAAIIQGVVMATLILTAFLYSWVMPLQSKFFNTIRATFKNAFYMSFKYILRTVLMGVLNAIPVGTLFLIFFVLQLRGFSIWLLFGVSVPIYWCALLYDKVFEQLEEMVLENQQNEEIEQIEAE